MSPGPAVKMGPGTHEYPGLRSYIARVMLRRQDGQIIPGLVMIMISLVIVGMLFFQVGRAAIFSTEAQSGADAVALAAANDIKAQLLRQMAATGVADIAAVNPIEVQVAGQRYAHINHVTAVIHQTGADVRVLATTEKSLGDAARSLHEQDEHGFAHAHARVEISVLPGGIGGAAGSIGTVDTGADPTIDSDEWKKLGKEISDPPTCGTGASSNDLIKLGHLLQKHGFAVGENAEMGDNPAPGVHDSGGWHYKCRNSGALDVNHDQSDEKGAIDGIVKQVNELGFRTIWQAEGHFDHIHIDVANSGSIGGGYGSGGSVGGLEETTLVVKLVDWNSPDVVLPTFGGATGGFFGGPPDLKVAATICKVLDEFHASPKVRLSAFETAIVESGVHNIPVELDHDSLGVFQQRASWGTREQRLDPKWAAEQYVRKAVAIDSSGMSPGQLAQAVQISEFPSRYDEHALQASALMTSVCGN
jgi:hypothetical protein